MLCCWLDPALAKLMPLQVFAQHYGSHTTSEQKDALFALMRKHTHRSITPVIRRHLVQARARGEAMNTSGVEAMRTD